MRREKDRYEEYGFGLFESPPTVEELALYEENTSI